MTSLSTVSIQAILNELGYYRPLDMHHFECIDSTNQFLKNHPSSSTQLAICIAEQQTKGRGRFGRTWHSPHGCNVYFSSRWSLPGAISTFSALGLVIGIAVITAIQNLSVPIPRISLKWPNDLFWHAKKLGGILIECVASTRQQTEVIIGIGLNVNAHTETESVLNACSLIDITGQLLDRNQLIAHLIQQTDEHLTHYCLNGFAAYHDRWQQLDYLMNKRIQIMHHTDMIEGYACGVTPAGQLIVIDLQNKTHHLASGDASLSIKSHAK